MIHQQKITLPILFYCQVRAVQQILVEIPSSLLKQNKNKKFWNTKKNIYSLSKVGIRV